MGGIGSGRRWQFGADTTDSYSAIDVRRWARDGLLSGQALHHQAMVEEQKAEIEVKNVA